MATRGASPSALAETATAWPLAGEPAFARAPLEWRNHVAARFERDLRRHVIDAWFPRSVDHECGGFFSDFDRRWRLAGPQHRMLEFQARQTRSAARLGIAFPSEPRWATIALHGLRYLREVMHDRSQGGWYWMVDRAGAPLAAATKHAHSTAYVIHAGVEVHRLTGSPEALQMARDAYEWLEANLHDDVNGGYHGWAARDGTPILTSAQVPGEGLREPLGHGLALKDINVHSDLLEALSLLFAVSPSEELLKRVGELYEAVTARFAAPGGAVHYMLAADWTPVPTLEEYGSNLQTARRVTMAAPLVGRSLEDALVAARRITDHAVELGRLEDGGFACNGPAAAPLTIEGVSLVIRRRSFWAQAEALKILLLLALQGDRPHLYRRLTDELIAFIDRELIDHRHGGWMKLPTAERPRRGRLGMGSSAAKGDVWKDASHETDLYLDGLRMLRGLSATAALEPGAS